MVSAVLNSAAKADGISRAPVTYSAMPRPRLSAPKTTRSKLAACDLQGRSMQHRDHAGKDGGCETSNARAWGLAHIGKSSRQPTVVMAKTTAPRQRIADPGLVAIADEVGRRHAAIDEADTQRVVQPVQHRGAGNHDGHASDNGNDGDPRRKGDLRGRRSRPSVRQAAARRPDQHDITTVVAEMAMTKQVEAVASRR